MSNSHTLKNAPYNSPLDGKPVILRSGEPQATIVDIMLLVLETSPAKTFGHVKKMGELYDKLKDKQENKSITLEPDEWRILGDSVKGSKPLLDNPLVFKPIFEMFE